MSLGDKLISNPVGAYRLLSAAWVSLGARVCDTTTSWGVKNNQDMYRDGTESKFLVHHDEKVLHRRKRDVKEIQAAFKTD